MKEHNIEEFYRAMVRNQNNYLYNEDKTIRELHFVTSRTTTENKEIIDNICASVKKTFESYIPEEIEVSKTNLCIQAFKFLILNAKFQVQELLLEDELCGHLVRMISPISSYLLIEVIFSIKYESVLAESILHFPLDLCDEILDIIPRCLGILEFGRGSQFLLTIIPNSYKKLHLLRDVGTQSGSIGIVSRSFVGGMQELISQFNADSFLQLQTLKKSEKYKRHGILLKKIIRMVKMCFVNDTNNVSTQTAKMYNLSFGNQPIEKLGDESLLQHLKTIDRELINLLLKKIKDVNCNIYMEWAEFDDEENVKISLQRAIGLECYHFVETLKEDERLGQCNHLIECLQQISSKPDPKELIENLSLPQLLDGVNEQKKEYLMEILKRHNEWDSKVCEEIENNLSVLERKDCELLLQQLMTTEPVEFEQLDKFHKYCVCIAKALFLFKITDIYEIVTSLVFKSIGQTNSIESLVKMNSFVNYLSQNPNFSTAKDLRVVLFFTILQPRKTIEILMKMAIGHEDFVNIISLDDLFLLAPIMNILVSSETCFASEILKDIVLQKKMWNTKKFSDLIKKMVNDLSSCEPSNVICNIFTPYLLSDDVSVSPLKSILNEFRRMQNKCSEGQMDIVSKSLNKVSHKMRNSVNVLKCHSDEILFLIKRILLQFFQDGRKEFTESLVKQADFVDPIDLPYFSGQATSVLSIIQRYNNLCVLQSTASTNLREDIIRHLILRCTSDEYVKYVKEITDSDACIITLKFNNKFSAYDNLIRLTMESCLLALEYPTILPVDTVGFLLKCLARVLRSEMCSGKQLRKNILSSLIQGVNILKLAIGETAYAAAFDKFQLLLKSSKVEDLVQGLNEFGCECLRIGSIESRYDRPKSTISVRNFLGYNYVTSSLVEGNVFCLNETTDKVLKQLKKEESDSDS